MNVVLASGHMIDALDRSKPRFPAGKAEAVRAAIAAQLQRWEIAEGDLAISSGASGADILFGEECQKRGVRLSICLAQEPAKFLCHSVQPAGDDWVARFHALEQTAEVKILPENFADEVDASIYERTNLWMIENARAVAEPGKLFALLVWDEKPTGDGPGGTSDFAARARALGARLAIINPLTIR